ncbi:hypothetical protein FSC37_15720 [Piscinibacter aquaticus]|uniref:GtrA/DPMS transmembrane domain-containing protein n=1 Tax=Piscinibacter aquaticus TaxID=392597 RepID=A0A5C6U2C2_9BURK|nr:hypothetical protein FSC37_15720 [Piscinibacter aquaticus]
MPRSVGWPPRCTTRCWPCWSSAGAGPPGKPRALAAMVGAQVAYAGNRAFTFAHRGAVLRSWPRFQLTALAGAAFGMVLVAASQVLGAHYFAGRAGHRPVDAADLRHQPALDLPPRPDPG